MKYIANADAWLIANVFEPIAWRIEYRVPFLTNFWVARIMYFVSCTFFGAIFPIWLSFLIAGAIMLRFNRIDRHEKMLRRNPGTMNPEKADWSLRWMNLLFFSYISVKVFTLPLSGELVFISFYAIWNLSFFFSACNPMPPGWAPKAWNLLPDLAPQPTTA